MAKCQKCGDFKKIHPLRDNGKPDYSRLVYCTCYVEGQTRPKTRGTPHAELQKYHYQALKNPAYQLEGMADVLREEMMMNIPVRQPEQVSPPATNTEAQPWSASQWDKVQQLQGRILHLQGEVNRLLAVKKDKGSAF